MIILKSLPQNEPINYITFYTDSIALRLADANQLPLLFDRNQEQKEVRIVKQEYQSVKKTLFDRMHENARSLSANAIIEFQFEHQKIDTRTLWLTISGTLVQLNSEKIKSVSSPFLFDDNPTQRDNEDSLVEKKAIMPKIDIVKSAMQDDGVAKVGNLYPDIGGSHQMNMLTKYMKNSQIDNSDSEKSDLIIPAKSLTIIQNQSIGEGILKGTDQNQEPSPIGEIAPATSIISVPLMPVPANHHDNGMRRRISDSHQSESTADQESEEQASTEMAEKKVNENTTSSVLSEVNAFLNKKGE